MLFLLNIFKDGKGYYYLAPSILDTSCDGGVALSEDNSKNLNLHMYIIIKEFHHQYFVIIHAFYIWNNDE